jgi:hypothetical protein
VHSHKKANRNALVPLSAPASSPAASALASTHLADAVPQPLHHLYLGAHLVFDEILGLRGVKDGGRGGGGGGDVRAILMSCTGKGCTPIGGRPAAGFKGKEDANEGP